MSNNSKEERIKPLLTLVKEVAKMQVKSKSVHFLIISVSIALLAYSIAEVIEKLAPNGFY